MGSKFLFTSLLVLLLIFTTRDGNGMMMKVDARTCQSQSHGFKGTCLSERNCRLVCKNEGFPNGKCVGLRRRCFCTRPCP